MSEHDRGDARGPAPHQSTESSTPFSVSRRTLVKTAAGAGVVAATVGMVGAAHAAGTPSSEESAALTGAPLAAGSSAANGPVVVHVLDAAAGTLEIFTNGSRTQVTNADLANRILRVAKD
jgi:hypothetical protein